MTAPRRSVDALVDGLSREFVLVCDAAGTIVEADGRAARRLGARPGGRLDALVAPGSEGKARAMLDAAGERDLQDWELVFVVDGRPATVSVRGGVTTGGLGLVGSIVPEAFVGALHSMHATMTELVELHRTAELHKRALSEQNDELRRLYRELDESGKGLRALHAELEEKSDSLHRSSEVKTRLVANVSHEFRTPLNSILSLTRLLLDETDGPITDEQRTQIGFIRASAAALSSLTNDLLDLSKGEAGKQNLRASRMEVTELFAALRGMLRPLVTSEAVTFTVEDPPTPLPPLETDEGKVAQILRNLVSNALKFTPAGEVRVWAEAGPGDTMRFHVADTGVGIAPADLPRVFEEFTQLDNPLQASVKGTGLGLTLSRNLAIFLGGDLTATSEVGRGSTFTLTVPRTHADVTTMRSLEDRAAHLTPDDAPVLVVEDDRQTIFVYEKYLTAAGYHVLAVRSVDEARTALTTVRPSAIVLDVMLEGESTWGFLAALKTEPATRDIPVMVVTVTDRERKARALGADEFVVKPIEQEWLVRKLARMARTSGLESVLVVDDDPVHRYVMKKHLAGSPYKVLEAENGDEGVRIAREQLPQVIFLDFVMPGMTAFEVIDILKGDVRTRSIPIIINTSKGLAADERRRLGVNVEAILSKGELTRETALERVRDALANAGVRRTRSPLA